MTLAPGNYDVTAEAWDYRPGTITDVLITSQTIGTLDFALIRLRQLYLPLIARN
jgi:hypothetical protein